MAVILKSLRSVLLTSILISVLISISVCDKAKESKKDKDVKAQEKIGKNILDYSDADMHKLLDQWEVKYLSNNKMFCLFAAYLGL